MSLASVFSRFLPVPTHRVSAPTARTAGRPTAAFWTLILGTAALLPAALHAQSSGTLDPTFLSALTEATVFAVTTQEVTSGTTTTDYILAGGDADMLLLLDPEGAVPTTFTDPIIGSQDRLVYTIVPEMVIPTGATTPNFLLGGLFGATTLTNGTKLPKRNITRISIDGPLDTTFDPGKGADNFVTSIVPQANGQILVGGQFLNFNNVAYPRLVLLNHDGSIATSFAPVKVDDSVYAIAAQIDPGTGQPNGQFVIGGSFNTIGTATYTKLARIDLSGNVDTTFKPVIDTRVLALAVQPDGKIIIGGQFTTVNGHAAGNIARLNQDGTFDPTFNASVSGTPDKTSDPVTVYVLHLFPDGRLYVGGNFSAVDGTPRQYLARVETDGSLDTTFDPGTTITNSVQALAVQADAKLLVGETVSKKINNVFPPSLIRLYGDVGVKQSTVKLTVPQGNAYLDPSGTHQYGVYRIEREQDDLTQPLTVYLEVTGSARSGVDYRPFAATQASGDIYQATFAVNQKVLKLKIRPLETVVPNAPETVTLRLVPSLNFTALYNVAEQAMGTVNITDAP